MQPQKLLYPDNNFTSICAEMDAQQHLTQTSLNMAALITKTFINYFRAVLNKQIDTKNYQRSFSDASESHKTLFINLSARAHFRPPSDW